MATGLVTTLFIVAALVQIVNSANDEFKEELLIKPFPNGYVYTHFQFTTTWNISLTDPNSFQHYHLFPKSLGEVLVEYKVQELHLSLTQGLWRYDYWGYPVEEAPPGAQVWVWFQPGTQNVDSVWLELINVLSGMFCASLNFMDNKATVTPKVSFRPRGVTPKHTLYEKFSEKNVRYAALPRENVCTENLTPWKKLLPCGSRSLSSFTMTHEPDRIETASRGRIKVKYAVYDVAAHISPSQIFNLGVKYDHGLNYIKPDPPVLHATTFQTVLQHYVPGQDRQRPYHLELVLSLPPQSVTRIGFEFERALLKWTEYPPDANHGFYINSASISAMISSAKQYTSPSQNSARIGSIFEDTASSLFVRLQTESLLITLPTPDFSMPYNVICLACTVVAIAFGSIHNLTTRRFVIKDPNKQTGLIGKIKKFFQKKKTDTAESAEKTESKGDEPSVMPKSPQRQVEAMDVSYSE